MLSRSHPGAPGATRRRPGPSRAFREPLGPASAGPGAGSRCPANGNSPQPDFAGHQLCTSQPYVQGLDAAAPFHPTATGQSAIALADQAVLRPSCA